MPRWKDALRALWGRPVRNAAYLQKQTRDVLSQIAWFDSDEGDWAASRVLLKEKIFLPPTAKDRVRWLLCQFDHPYGGVFTVLRIADALQRQGFDNEIMVYDNPSFDFSPHREAILRYFPALEQANFVTLQDDAATLAPCEFAVATFWPSAQHLLKMQHIQNKLYLIQDFEPAFYPAGSSYALAEMSYRMPFHRLINTPGLKGFLDQNYPQGDIRSLSFTPAVDARYRRKPRMLPKPADQNPIRVLFYARPGTPRNAFELAMAFARELKNEYGEEIELVAAGSKAPEWEKSMRSVLSWAGVVAYEALPDFYASFHVIIAFMLTKHPSYIPFEAMAAGCAVIANVNESNTWFLRDGENCMLAQPTIPSLMAAFSRITETERYAAITQAASRTADALDWERELLRIVDFFKALQ